MDAVLVSSGQNDHGVPLLQLVKAGRRMDVRRVSHQRRHRDDPVVAFVERGTTWTLLGQFHDRRDRAGARRTSDRLWADPGRTGDARGGTAAAVTVRQRDGAGDRFAGDCAPCGFAIHRGGLVESDVRRPGEHSGGACRSRGGAHRRVEFYGQGARREHRTRVLDGFRGWPRPGNRASLSAIRGWQDQDVPGMGLRQRRLRMPDGSYSPGGRSNYHGPAGCRGAALCEPQGSRSSHGGRCSGSGPVIRGGR